MYKKKISTIAIITILTLTLLIAAIPMAHAMTIDTMTPPSGPVGQKVTITGLTGGATPFAPLEVYWDNLDPANKIKDGYALSNGAFTIANVVIPAGIEGVHYVIVKDTLSDEVDSATFTITSEIDLSTEKGLPGDAVTVTGTGFGDEVDVSIYLGDIINIPTESVALSGTPVTGTFAQKPVTILSVALTVDVTIDGLIGTQAVTETGSPTVTVTDDGEGNLEGFEPDIAVAGGTDSGEVDVTITGTINYATGVITLTASGVDSAGTGTVTAIVVTISTPCSADYDYAEYEVTPVTGATTSDVGSFDTITMIPAIAEIDYDPYTVTAIDTDGNTATATLTVDYYITVTPPSGPTGITITIAGRIEATTNYDLFFNGAPIAAGTSDGDGVFSKTYVIDAVLSTATYDVDVVWAVTKKKTEQFTVTAPPQVVYAPTSGVAGAVVKISTVAGFPFSAGANITLYLGTHEVNSTQLDDRFGPTGSTGTFTDLEFTVPTLAPGPYALKVIDEYGASTTAIYTFTVLPTPVTTTELRATSYYQGDTISFNIVTTDTIPAGLTVTIRDPAGSTWWTATWTLTGTVSKVVLYQNQLFGTVLATLPADAPLGSSWNWTITYTPASTGISTKATGLFTVSAPPSMQSVLDKLVTMEASIKSVVTTSEGRIVAVVNTKSGQVMVELDAIDAKLQGIEDMGIIIATDVGEIKVDIDSLDMGTLGVDITSIKGNVATIKTNIGTVTTAVSNLDAKVTSLSGSVATVSTSLGTLQGTVTSIEGNVATISTDVGTLEADISDISKVDMTPAWLAVILSLVAAIAAIFAVITIRQKIAG